MNQIISLNKQRSRTDFSLSTIGHLPPINGENCQPKTTKTMHVLKKLKQVNPNFEWDLLEGTDSILSGTHIYFNKMTHKIEN